VKIGLAVGYFDPQVGGSEEVVKRLAAGLASRGHDVLVATSRHPDRRQEDMATRVEEFDVAGNTVTGISGDVLGYQEFLSSSDRDVWLFYAAQIWSTDLALPLLGRLDAACVVVPCGYSGLNNLAFDSYFRHLPQALARADALVYMSTDYQDYAHDAARGLSHLAVVIPNGADVREFGHPPTPKPDRPGRNVLCVANHYPDKGHDAVISAFQAVAGRHDRLSIVGNNPARHPLHSCFWKCRAKALRDRRIRLHVNTPRSDVVRMYFESDVFLFGSRVECAPLVILEAMAAGVPFISTPAGNVRDYEGCGLVAPEQDLASALERLLTDPDLRHTLGEAGRRRWEAGHTWDTITDEYERLFSRLVARRSGVPADYPGGASQPGGNSARSEIDS
jgi:glycosyltransferase involved in cell wall biosynthesis